MEHFENPVLNDERNPLGISEEAKVRLAELFEGKELGGEKIPPIVLRLYSGMHGTAEDTEGLKKEMEEADLYIPEGYNWSEDRLSRYRKIAEGKRAPRRQDSALFRFGSAIDTLVEKTHKPIVFADIPSDEVERNPDDFGGPQDITDQLDYCDYEEAVKLVSENIAETDQRIIVNRERYMLEHLPEQIERALHDYPDLKKKEIIHVLMTLGEAHSALYHVLKEVGKEKVSREYHGHPVIFDHVSEVGRRSVFGKPISEELEKDTFMEFLINEELIKDIYTASQNSEKNSVFFRYIATLFNDDERKEIFEEWKQDRQSGEEGDFKESFKQRLFAKGVKFPENEEELDNLLLKTKYSVLIKDKKENHAADNP